MGLADEPNINKKYSDFMHRKFSNDETTFVVLLVVNDHQAEAKEVAEEERMEWDEPSFGKALICQSS